ncbi:MAG: hypothetical protein BWY70_00440 [Bacteroidetes bacterium ADurb.Bin408]|nr:MAG: hypothetical protein BWY70_00440 [Bacteroidetes bacterium ADurb.Bin408]
MSNELVTFCDYFEQTYVLTFKRAVERQQSISE